MKRNTSFEDIDKHFCLSNKALIVTMYHWASPDTVNYSYPLQLKDLTNDKELYVCDDAYAWATPHLLETCQLYEIDCVFQKPLIVLNQFLDFEGIFDKSSPEYDLFIKGGFDSVIYTPHAYGRGVRQCLIRNAKKQILDVREINKPCLDEVRQSQQKQAKLWREIFFNKK